MAYENKPGDGVLFRNDKRTSDKQPEYKGHWFNENCEKCNVAAWVRESKNTGEKFFSLQIELQPWKPEGSGEEPQHELQQSDDVPF